MEEALTQVTKKLLDKSAIEMVKDHSSPGFYSRLFLVDKRDRGFRPVIDLSILNTYMYLEATKFKMETTSSIIIWQP